ncbi:hypothetical protein COO60DRAFT_1463192 [Scenedesmus sp. NREL 46B-D3]|nr:hypothetical protein COO60DRAFT_1463192 [Scenedesmus sp. NREL 46B-D3]
MPVLEGLRLMHDLANNEPSGLAAADLTASMLLQRAGMAAAVAQLVHDEALQQQLDGMLCTPCSSDAELLQALHSALHSQLLQQLGMHLAVTPGESSSVAALGTSMLGNAVWAPWRPGASRHKAQVAYKSFLASVCPGGGTSCLQLKEELAAHPAFAVWEGHAEQAQGQQQQAKLARQQEEKRRTQRQAQQQLRQGAMKQQQGQDGQTEQAQAHQRQQPAAPPEAEAGLSSIAKSRLAAASVSLASMPGVGRLPCIRDELQQQQSLQQLQRSGLSTAAGASLQAAAGVDVPPVGEAARGGATAAEPSLGPPGTAESTQPGGGELLLVPSFGSVQLLPPPDSQKAAAALKQSFVYALITVDSSYLLHLLQPQEAGKLAVLTRLQGSDLAAVLQQPHVAQLQHRLRHDSLGDEGRISAHEATGTALCRLHDRNNCTPL